VQAPGKRDEFRDEFARLLREERDPAEIAQLAREDDDGDAGREANRHRIRNELDIGADPQEARSDQEQARHQRRQDHAVNPVTVGGRRNQHNEGAGRTADLESAAAEQ
jgi:hypothetical protein